MEEWGDGNGCMRLTTRASELFSSAGMSPVVNRYVPRVAEKKLTLKSERMEVHLGGGKGDICPLRNSLAPQKSRNSMYPLIFVPSSNSII